MNAYLVLEAYLGRSCPDINAVAGPGGHHLTQHHLGANVMGSSTAQLRVLRGRNGLESERTFPAHAARVLDPRRHCNCSAQPLLRESQH